MLNHSGPFHFGPKVVFICFFTIYICPYTPFKGKWGSGSISWHVETFYCEETSPFKYLKFFSQNAEPLRPLPFWPKSGVYLIFYNIFCPYTPFKGRWGSGSISWHVETFIVRKLAHLNIWSFSAKMLNHSTFRPKSGVYLIFYNICPYTPFKGKWELTSISWHVETFIVRKLAHLNIWSFSAKMLNHSGLCHFSPKVVFIWFFTIFAPTPPFKGRWGSGSISWHVETFVVRKLAHLNIWSFSAKMLNHSGPCHFGPKVVFIWFFTIFAPTPLSKANEGRRPSHGM